MGKKLGTAVLVKVSVSAGGYAPVEFQQSGSLTRSASPADVSNKDSNQHNESIVAFDNWEVSLGCVHDESATGQEIMRNRWENQANVFVQLVEVNGSKTHTGQGQVTDWSLDAPHDGATTISGTIQGTGALVTA